MFELTPGPSGWTGSVLYNFCSDFVNFQCLDGTLPAAGLVFDAKGNLYGTTNGGGNQPCSFAGSGCGTVFELSPPLSQGGAWTETVLYDFCSNDVNFQCLDGALPTSQLVLDASDNIYGTTTTGGAGGSSGGCCAGGTVFELTPGAGGWTETVLYNFCAMGGSICPDGTGPQAGVIFGKDGNLYGTTELGGGLRSAGGGTIYRLSPGSNGWTETVLYAYRPPFGSGGNPFGSVAFDPLGNLYSTFSFGGQYNFGGVTRLSPKDGGTSAKFSFGGNDGGVPHAGVLLDAKHSALFGTTESGNALAGSVFQLVGNGQETVLHTFCFNCSDGAEPVAGLIQDKSGNLYGTTKLGGANNFGIVFQITPTFPKRRTSKGAPVWHPILPSKR